jgi:hypothetical protein
MFNENIINMLSFTFFDSIYKWGKKKLHDHPNCTFVELEQAFCKRYKMEKNDEQIYLKLRNVKWE